MRLLYHNHNWEMAELEGRLALDWLFDAAGPGNLEFEADLAWIEFGGVDPVALLQRYSGRCPRIHAKDLAPKGQNLQEAVRGAVMADVGYGTLKWPEYLAAARAAGAEWYIIEHDNPREPIASVSRSLAYLSQVLPDILR